MNERKIIKRTLKAVVIAGVLVIIIYFVVDFILQKKINQQLTSLSPALQIKYKSLHTDILSSSISFDSVDINFTPYDKRQQNSHHLSFSKVSLSGIRFFSFLFHKKLNAHDLLAMDGNIRLDSFLLEKKDSAQPDILKKIKLPFNTVSIDNIELQKINFFQGSSQQPGRLLARGNVALRKVSVNDAGNDPSAQAVDLRLSDVNFSFDGYQIKTPHIIARGNTETVDLQLSDLDFSFNGYNIKTPLLVINSNKKTLEVDSVKLSSDHPGPNKITLAKIKMTGLDMKKTLEQKKLVTKTIFIDDSRTSINHSFVDIKKIEADVDKNFIRVKDISVIPQTAKYELARKLGHQADWIKAEIGTIDMQNADIEKLFDQKLFADKISISQSRIYIFRDRRLPRPLKNIPLPVDYLKGLAVDIHVHSCELSDAAIEYEEFPKSGYDETGILKIENVKLSISPFINHPSASGPSYITMNAEGSIMGSGTSHCTVIMPLEKNDPYRITGRFDNVELTTLNSSSENLGKIRIKSGFLNFLFFDFMMTREQSTGKIIGAYHHLVIEPMKKHKEEKNVADFSSFMLRHFIIPLNKDSTLSEKKRTGLVDYKRDPTRMVSYYFLQSLLMGIKKSFKLGFLLPK